jgi:hypothetical protein
MKNTATILGSRLDLTVLNLRLCIAGLFATLTMGLAPPASASQYVRADFTGQVLSVGSSSPTGIAVDTPIYFDAVYDLDKLVDHTATVDAATGLGFASVLAASLSDDPNASLTITVGSISFDKFDQENYGTPEGDAGPGGDLGLGNFPAVTYLNGSLAGVGNIFINSDGYSLDADPIADAFGGFDLGSGLGGYDFALSRVVGGDPFGETFAVGNFDAKDAIFSSAAPEPGTWLLMFVGIGGIGLMARRSKGKQATAREITVAV